MDISDIGKVASRKRLNVEAEKLREKVSRETAKIIKLKVAQDTAYWDLKEKLQQVEGNHERLQQNMVEVQMQHEAISGQYQDELRLRPETLNKMTSTREICDVLEEYSERLKETLSRCKSDQATLCEAYQTSGQLVRDIKLKQLRGDERNQQLIERLEEKVKLTSEHQNQLVQYFTAAKQQSDAELEHARAALAATRARHDELQAGAAELRARLERQQQDVLNKEETISSLQKDIKQVLHEFNVQAADMKNTILKQEKELKETLESNEALKKALCNQEAFTKSICDQNSQLQEKISSLEDENIANNNAVKELENKLEVAITSNEENKKLLDILSEKKDQLETDLASKNEVLKNFETENQELKLQLSRTENEVTMLTESLGACKAENETRAARIAELDVSVQELKGEVEGRQMELDQLKATTTQQITELTTTIQLKEKELDTKAGTIAQLMTEVQGATDARGRLELNMQKLRADTDAERDAARERERVNRKQVEQLELVVRNKDDEISKQISIILEIRAEKERLQEKIQSMQNTIDNIQKELTGRVAPSAHRQPPDHDDNAVMCAPTQDLSQSPKLPVKFAVLRSEPKQMDLFALFSDGSVDGDTIDPTEVNRRFSALSRGERVAPLGLAALKRRAPRAPPRAGLQPKPAHAADSLSLSQVKDDILKKDKSFFKTKRADPKNKKMRL